jgi:transcriptional regulator with XRE-family HTH domain
MGKRIAYLRKISGLSQEELGKRIGVQRAAVNKYEKETVENIPISTIEKIAKVFDVSPNFIVGWDDTKSNPLTAEVRIIQGVKNIYGDDVVNLIESYIELKPEGKERINQHLCDMWKLYHE